MAADPVRIIPLGGFGEVGKNMTVFEYRDRMVLLDAGPHVPARRHARDRHRAARLQLREGAGRQLDAIVLTHGHEDHIGALPYVLREIGTRAPV